MKHQFQIGKDGCAFVDPETDKICHKKQKHLIHKMPKIRQYQEGETVGQYVVGRNGQFLKRKEENENS